MYTIRLSVLATAFIVAASSASAQQAGTTAPSTDDIVVKGQQYEKKVVCRQQQSTGTRFATRVCHTNKVWDEMREQHMRGAREMIDRPEIDITRNQ